MIYFDNIFHSVHIATAPPTLPQNSLSPEYILPLSHSFSKTGQNSASHTEYDNAKLPYKKTPSKIHVYIPNGHLANRSPDYLSYVLPKETHYLYSYINNVVPTDLYHNYTRLSENVQGTHSDVPSSAKMNIRLQLNISISYLQFRMPNKLYQTNADSNSLQSSRRP